MVYLRTDVNNFRMKRKCSIQFGSWIFMYGTLMLLLIAVPNVSCTESDEVFNDGFNADDYGDVDNVEWHHVKIIDGVLQPEEHPVIFYKEDIVNEDYDPAKEKRKNDTAADAPKLGHRSRKYKEISRRHRYNRKDAEKYSAIKSEKTYFDILPQAPVVTAADDSAADDSRFDTSKIRVEVMSLADDINVNDNAEKEKDGATESKQILSKRPKKYRRRQRRDATSSADDHKVKKRNPYYVNGNANNNLIQYLQNLYATSNQHQPGSRRYPIRGNYWNALSVPIDTASNIETRAGFEPDRVIWSVRPARVLPPKFHEPNQNNIENSPTRRPTRPTVTAPPLIRDPNPNNADKSFLTTSRPQFVVPPLIRDPNPGNADTSFLTRRPPTQVSQQRPTMTTARPTTSTVRPTQGAPKPERKISNCVWAIAQCCSRNNLNIRYQCFEELGCYGAFWDLNPCAENIVDNVLEYVDQYLTE